MPTAPRVSIVIPVHNDEATVAAAIESCLAQSMQDIEIICVDDASTDATPTLLAAFAERDSRVHVIRHESNMSAFQGRRAGVFAARGEYVLFVDGDDELATNAAERVHAVAAESKADLIGFGVAVISPDGGTVGGYQSRLRHKHARLKGAGVLEGLFPMDKPAQGQLWRYAFRTALLREAYELLPADLVLPRINDLPLLYLAAALADSYVSIDERLYRYFFGRGGSGQAVDSRERLHFYADGIRSIESIRPAVVAIARRRSNPAGLLDSYESVRLSIIGYITSYLLRLTTDELRDEMLEHLQSCASATDLALAAARFYPDSLRTLKQHSKPVDLKAKKVRNVLLTTRTLTTGGVSGVLLAQARFLMDAGYGVTIVARRYGSDPSAVPDGAEFIEMVARGLADRLVEWAGICRSREIDVIIDHQVLYSRDWPEYALIARSLGIANIGWLHNFAGRPIYDLNGLHELLTENAVLLENLVSLSPLDVAFWKLRGVEHSSYIPNPPSPLVLESAGEVSSKQLSDRKLELVWWGRLDEHTKKVSQLIEVADELRKLGVDFHLTVIGPEWADWSPERFNELVRERKLSKFVDAVGPRRGADLTASIDAADLFVSTSIIEGYQLTIAEAQVRGVPVAMYELPWLTLVQNNDGIVTAPQQNPAALAHQIAELSRDPERYERLSKASLVAAKRELSHDFAGLYQQVVTDSLPAAYSPEPTMADSKQLLDLVIFFAEQHAGIRSAAAPVGNAVAAPEPVDLRQPKSKQARAMQAAKPVAKTVLQVLPGLRPMAHKAKRAAAKLRK